MGILLCKKWVNTVSYSSDSILVMAVDSFVTYTRSASEDENGMHKTLSKSELNSCFISTGRKTLAQKSNGGNRLFQQ